MKSAERDVHSKSVRQRTEIVKKNIQNEICTVQTSTSPAIAEDCIDEEVSVHFHVLKNSYHAERLQSSLGLLTAFISNHGPIISLNGKTISHEMQTKTRETEQGISKFVWETDLAKLQQGITSEIFVCMHTFILMI